jgi:transposase-like protein
MRYPASEKLEIIRIVEQSHLPAKKHAGQLGIPRRTFYRWYDRYLEGGPEALEDRPSAPSRVWNRIPTESMTRSSRWRWRVRTVAHVNWRCGSPTRSATSCQKPAFTGC